MVKRRDRHERGLRGPVLSPASVAFRTARLPGQLSRAEAFLVAVQEAVTRISSSCPEALVGIDIGIEDVPRAHSTGGRVPLAAATEAAGGFPARVVVFRRPLEHRSMSRRGLQILVHRTLVEQLSALTGRSVSEIDPQVDLDDED